VDVLHIKYISLSDHNIGNSYNPWLVFENEKDALECREMMPVTIVATDYFPYYDEYDFYS